MKRVTHILPILLFYILIVLGCKKQYVMTDGMVGLIGAVINHSTVQIKIIPVYEGVIYSDKYKIIDIDARVEMGNSMSMYSLPNKPGFPSEFIGADSLQVIYDNTYKLTYLVDFDDSLLLPHHIPYVHKFNFRNIDNYIYWYDEYLNTNINEFTFTPEQYEYAKLHGILVE